MNADRKVHISRQATSQKAFYSDIPGKYVLIAMRLTIDEVLPRRNAIFPVQFEPPWY